MKKLISKRTTVDLYEMTAILNSHYETLGRRYDEYRNEKHSQFLIDISLENIKIWKNKIKRIEDIIEREKSNPTRWRNIV